MLAWYAPISAAPFRVFGEFAVGVVLLQFGQLETPEEVGTHGRLLLGSDGDVGDDGIAGPVVEDGPADQQGVAPVCVHLRVIVAGVSAAALGALQCRLG